MKTTILAITMVLLCKTISLAGDNRDDPLLNDYKTVYCYGFTSTDGDNVKVIKVIADDMRVVANRLYPFYRSIMDDTAADRSLKLYSDSTIETISLKIHASILEREYLKGKEASAIGNSIAKIYILRQFCKEYAQKLAHR